jgi:beta-galactosidase
MRQNHRHLQHLFAAAFLFTCTQVYALAAAPRVTMSADHGWRFNLGDTPGAEAPAFADQKWRTVNLPHDWSIEGRPDKNNPSGAGGGFFPTGLGWYRKTFQAPADWAGHDVSLEFDGIYRNATIYLNGRKLRTQAYGYTSFSLDLTGILTLGQPNTLAVRVDNSTQPNSRWYSGSGIYRHVRLVVTNPSHVAQWGVHITTPAVSANAATVKVETTLASTASDALPLTILTTLYNSKGVEVGQAEVPYIAPSPEHPAITQSMMVKAPAVWDPASPNLYRAVTQVRRGKQVVDEVTTPFGIRSLTWSAEKGLLLNGKSIKLTGGSVHHDNGPLGAAAFDRAEERKVELLKAAGHNAVRTAHNIPSPAFLDACDRLGLLVLDESFDSWEAHKVKADYGSDFDANWNADISGMVLRDRNHPSIVIWGIGNEIPELTVEKGASMARQLVTRVQSLDTTRPLTLAFPGTTTAPTAQAVFSQLDITGYNYSLEKSYKQDHEALPNRLMLTTESFPAKAFELWEISTDHPYILGDLTWTSMDYLGESGIGSWSYGTPEQAAMASHIMSAMMTTATVDRMFNGMANGVDMEAAMKQQSANPAVQAAMSIMTHDFPWHASDCGDLDLTGFRKPQSYYRDILWNGGDRVFMSVQQPVPEGKAIIAAGWATYPTFPSWTWPGQEGKSLQVETYSQADHVRLYLNDKLVGEQPTGRAQAFRATFSVPYRSGKLKAVAIRAGQPVSDFILKTAGTATKLRLTADRSSLHADGQDLAFVTVEAIDDQGNIAPNASDSITFTLSGPGIIAAVGNGDGHDASPYVATERKLFHGRAQVVLRTGEEIGAITLHAQTAGLSPASTIVTAVGDQDRQGLP